MTTPKPPRPAPVPYTPTRADASVITAGNNEPTTGLSLITNNTTGLMQKRAQTGKTTTTGGSL